MIGSKPGNSRPFLGNATAVKGKSVSSTFSSLANSLDRGSCAVALDFAKCFDYAQPTIALQHFRLHKFPESLISLLEHVWLNQQRYLQIGSSFSDRPSASPLALIMILKDAVTDVSSLPGDQSVFLDDRVIVCPRVPELQRCILRWQSW